jgi:hypothetical protein
MYPLSSSFQAKTSSLNFLFLSLTGRVTFQEDKVKQIIQNRMQIGKGVVVRPCAAAKPA